MGMRTWEGSGLLRQMLPQGHGMRQHRSVGQTASRKGFGEKQVDVEETV